MLFIKNWFMDKLRDENRSVYLERHGEVVRETEKAYLLAIDYCSYDGERSGSRNFWVPKSCIMSEADLDAENERYENACSRYDELIEFARKNGVNVRHGMKTETIKRKIREAGLTI